MAFVIGIDIGTGSTKALAVDTSGKVLHTSQVSYPTLNPEPTYSEQAPDIIWKAFSKCISEICDTTKEKPSAVILSSAMHSTIPVDNSGTPLMNMITWADNRAADIATRIHESASGEMIYEQSGTPIHAMSPLCKIIWLKENENELFMRTHKFISIKEYIWFRIFNFYEIDHSIASATGLFDIEKLTWNKNSLELCNINNEKLSKPVPTVHCRKIADANVIREFNVNPETPFYIGASDGCMANIGSFAIQPGVAALTIGTSGAIRVGTKKPIFNFKAMTFNYCLLEDLFISGGPINNGGVALKWYAKSFLKVKLDTPADYDALLGQLDTINPCADGLIFLPYLLGERAPVWNSEASAMFFGMRNYHTQAHFTRAVVEGISMALYSIARAMEQSGLEIDRIHVSGGFVHATTWLQILADIFNKEIHLINAEDASSFGAAYLGMKSLGLIQTYDQLKPAGSDKFIPNKDNHALYQKAFTLYERLYKQLADEMSIALELKFPDEK